MTKKGTLTTKTIKETMKVIFKEAMMTAMEEIMKVTMTKAMPEQMKIKEWEARLEPSPGST